MGGRGRVLLPPGQAVRLPFKQRESATAPRLPDHLVGHVLQQCRSVSISCNTKRPPSLGYALPISRSQKRPPFASVDR